MEYVKERKSYLTARLQEEEYHCQKVCQYQLTALVLGKDTCITCARQGRIEALKRLIKKREKYEDSNSFKEQDIIL